MQFLVSSAKKKNILITKLSFVSNLADKVEKFKYVVRENFSSAISILEICQLGSGGTRF